MESEVTESRLCIFANRTEACGYTDRCDSGCWSWRTMDDDSPIYSMSHDVVGFKRVFKFCDEDKDKYFDIERGEEV
ncbi:hypothetical protein Bca52824_048101 [Brassica carinata]|uniref:Uncharacterized protein n=1 Tax=Brassica carinata TaxID=52824 RepID=A0A8X7URV4_BRACI|nr:hypothetical protein Bca52824_048101 [Brassica carinata]